MERDMSDLWTQTADCVYMMFLFDHALVVCDDMFQRAMCFAVQLQVGCFWLLLQVARKQVKSIVIKSENYI